MEYGVEQGNRAARRHFSVDKVHMCYWQKQHDKLLTFNRARRAWPWKVRQETVAVCKLHMCIFASKLSYLIIYSHFHLTFKFTLFRKSSRKFTLHIAPPNFALVFHGKKKCVHYVSKYVICNVACADHVQNTGHDIVWHLKCHLCFYTLILLGMM